jgi:DNA-binding LytR/AlgR family response regulator
MIITVNEKIMAHMTMNETIDLLPKTDFHRIHRSYIVALKHVKMVEKNHVKIANKSIPIGKYYREGFLKVLGK